MVSRGSVYNGQATQGNSNSGVRGPATRNPYLGDERIGGENHWVFLV